METPRQRRPPPRRDRRHRNDFPQRDRNSFPRHSPENYASHEFEFHPPLVKSEDEAVSLDTDPEDFWSRLEDSFQLEPRACRCRKFKVLQIARETLLQCMCDLKIRLARIWETSVSFKLFDVPSDEPCICDLTALMVKNLEERIIRQAKDSLKELREIRLEEPIKVHMTFDLARTIREDMMDECSKYIVEILEEMVTLQIRAAVDSNRDNVNRVADLAKTLTRGKLNVQYVLKRSDTDAEGALEYRSLSPEDYDFIQRVLTGTFRT